MDSIQKLKRLRALAQKQEAVTEDLFGEVQAKRATRRARRVNRPRQKTVNSRTVEGWWQDAMKEKYGDTIMYGRWTVAQKTMAKRLLKEFGEELVKKAIDHFVIGWDSFTRENTWVVGYPTINLLFSMRVQVMLDVQGAKSNKSAKNKDEHDEQPDDALGW